MLVRNKLSALGGGRTHACWEGFSELEKMQMVVAEPILAICFFIFPFFFLAYCVVAVGAALALVFESPPCQH